MADKPKFDPNKKFEAVDAEAKPKFDPSQPVEEPKSWLDEETLGMTPRGLAKGALQTLPVVGAIGGGILGTMGAPGLGTIAGAGAGGVAGESLKSTLESALGDGPQSREAYYRNLGAAGLGGAAGEGAGQLIGRAGEALGGAGVRAIGKAFNRPGSGDVLGAAERMGVKATDGMLTDDYMVRNLENSLSQSPSIPGSLVRREQQPIREAIASTSEKSLADATGQSPYEAGGQIKQGVTNYFEGRTAPLREAYGKIQEQTKHVDVNQKGLSRIADNIRGLPEAKFEGFEGNKIANQFANALEQVQNVDDIKLLATKAKQILRDPNASFEAKSVASSIVGKLDQAQTNTITRQAVSVARDAAPTRVKGKFMNAAQKAEADAVAVEKGTRNSRDLVGDVKRTNRSYRELMEDVKSFGKGSGLTKANKGMSAALEDIAQVKNEDLPKAIFDSSNLEFMKSVQSKMPKEFEVARQVRLAEISKKAQAPDGQIDAKKLQRVVDEMMSRSPEAAEMLFGKENLGKLKDVGTLLKSIPGKVGASDTPRGMAFQDLFSPQQVTDVGRYGVLKAKKLAPKAGLMIQGAPKTGTQGLINKGLLNDN